jgi:hypothetical protein
MIAIEFDKVKSYPQLRMSMMTKTRIPLFYGLCGHLMLALAMLNLSCNKVNGKVEAMTSQATSPVLNSPQGEQTEIADLLSLKGECFIEVARFKIEQPSDYWQHERVIQEIVNQLETYHRFIIRSEFTEIVEDNRLKHDLYYRLLVGPFDAQQAGQELVNLINIGYGEASVDQLPETKEGTYPSEWNDLRALYIKNQGPRLVSDFDSWGDQYLEYVVDEKNQKLLFHSVSTYHLDRNGGKLYLADGKTGTFHIFHDFEPQGLVRLPNGIVLVEKTFYLYPDDPPGEYFGDHGKIDRGKLTAAANAIDVAPESIPVDYDGGDRDEKIAKVSALFELDLETRQLKSLKLFGANGGLFLMEDGTLYSSRNTVVAYGHRADSKVALLSMGPYYRLDFKRPNSIKMPKDFTFDENALAQPLYADSNGLKEIKTIIEVGNVKLISFNSAFYLQHN